MNSITQVPSHLIPLDQLMTGCVLTGDPAIKGNSDGSPKKGKGPFEGLTAFVCPVRLLVGEETIEFPGRDPQTSLKTTDLRVTVWSDSAPSMKSSDFVVFDDVLVGAMAPTNGQAILYVQSTGIQKLDFNNSASANSSSSSNSYLEKGDTSHVH